MLRLPRSRAPVGAGWFVSPGRIERKSVVADKAFYHVGLQQYYKEARDRDHPQPGPSARP